MNDALLHRGPDAGGVFSENERIGLGHRRLSIIDTSHQADQPMVSNSGRWVIVFNGEIYNFREIRKELNYRFKTASDTEVILAAVEEKGIDWFLQRANGMFALALYNKASREMFILRDRLGIKPLYFYADKIFLSFRPKSKAFYTAVWPKRFLTKRRWMNTWPTGMCGRRIPFLKIFIRWNPAAT